MAATLDVGDQLGPWGHIKAFRRNMTRTQWLQARLMLGSIILLHIVGFATFILFVVPHHYKGLALGVAATLTHSGCATPSMPTTSRQSTTRPESS